MEQARVKETGREEIKCCEVYLTFRKTVRLN